jgi:long-chain acyl-CoA synthetase
MRGSLRRPEASAEVLRGGWLHTGDVGRFDQDGYLTLVDRTQGRDHPRRGEHLCQGDRERALHHPAVLEDAVVGQPDPVLGEQPLAFVVLRHGHNTRPADLIEHCRTSLARYKVPREVYIEKALPKNAIGKLDKRVLGERLRG